MTFRLHGLVLALVCPALLASASEGKTDDAQPDERAHLSLRDAAQRFFATDPSVLASHIAVAAATIGTSAARDRVALSVGMEPGFRGDFGSVGGKTIVLGAGDLPTSMSVTDPWGGAFDVTASAHGLTDPLVVPPGNIGVVDAKYTMPLLRNRLGSLWALEVAAAEQALSEQQANAKALHVERCALLLDLFAAARSLQEQRDVVQELLKLRDKTHARTSADYNNKLLTRLDYLASKTDLIAAKQRVEDLEGQARGAADAFLIVLGDAPGADIVLDDDDALHTVPAPEPGFVHPALLALQAQAAVASARAQVSETRLGPEISLIPGVGGSAFSHQPVGTTTSPSVNGYLSLSVGFELPLLQPQRTYEPLLLRKQADELWARKEAAARVLDERAVRAEASLHAADTQLALVQERLDLAQAELGEARQMYQAGRMEFQDYLQHFVIYEESRLERTVRTLAKARAEHERIAARGVEPGVCQETR